MDVCVQRGRKGGGGMDVGVAMKGQDERRNTRTCAY